MPVYDQHIGLEPLKEAFPANGGLHGRSFLDIVGTQDPVGWDEGICLAHVP